MHAITRALDGVMEATIVPSFTKWGSSIRRRIDGWSPVAADLTGKVMLVTGGTSGIGLAAARELAALGADVVIAGRSQERGGAAERSINDAPMTTGSAEFVELDVGDLDAVRAFAAEFCHSHDRLDALVHNAGALLPERKETAAGIEITAAVHLLGPYELTRRLRPLLAATPSSRVIFMSSGGMYAVGLVPKHLEARAKDYDGRTAYARVKRAQVVLAQVLAEDFAEDGIVVHSMHPGWVDTPGVDAGIPFFGKVMGPILRSPDEGADTLVWLAAADEPAETTGLFWHDRRPRNTVKLPNTKVDDDARAALVPWIEERIQAADDRGTTSAATSPA